MLNILIKFVSVFLECKLKKNWYNFGCFFLINLVSVIVVVILFSVLWVVVCLMLLVMVKCLSLKFGELFFLSGYLMFFGCSV